MTKLLLDCCFDLCLGRFFALFWLIVSWNPNYTHGLGLFLPLVAIFAEFLNTSSFCCRFCLFLWAALVVIYCGMLFYKKEKLLMARDWRHKSVFHCSLKEFMSHSEPWDFATSSLAFSVLVSSKYRILITEQVLFVQLFILKARTIYWNEI